MLKVAVASTDGINIDDHFGSAEEYFIYKIEDAGEYELINKISASSDVNATNGEHSSAKYRADLLKGVDAVLVAQIGPNAEKILQSNGIKAFALKSTIDDALKILAKKSKLIKNLFVGSNTFRGGPSGGCSGGCHGSCNK